MNDTAQTECHCEACGHSHCNPTYGQTIKLADGTYKNLGCDLVCGNVHRAEDEPEDDDGQRERDEYLANAHNWGRV